MKNSRLIVAIITAVLAIGLFGLALWYGGKVYDTYVQRLSEKRELVRFLEKNKQSFDLYKKILVQGSAEQDEVKKYVLSEKTSFTAISKIESDVFKTGLASKEKGGLMSVATRENANLTKFNARELIVVIEAEGPYQRVDDYIQVIDHLPYVSHIDQVDFSFIEKAQTTTSVEGPVVRARINLIIVETLANKVKTPEPEQHE